MSSTQGWVEGGETQRMPDTIDLAEAISHSE